MTSKHLIKEEVSELLTLVNLIDSVTLLVVRSNPSLSFSAPYFSFFFYKQENGYEGLQGKQSELWDIFKIQFNIPRFPSKYECTYHFFWAESWSYNLFLKKRLFQNDNFCINDKYISGKLVCLLVENENYSPDTNETFFFGFLGGKSIDPENPRTTNWFPPGRPEPSNRACVQREESTWVLGLCELHLKKSQFWTLHLVCHVGFYVFFEWPPVRKLHIVRIWILTTFSKNHKQHNARTPCIAKHRCQEQTLI